jgi:hypothetical protein
MFHKGKEMFELIRSWSNQRIFYWKVCGLNTETVAVSVADDDDKCNFELNLL